jgi:ligand-binding sensor domain-containing protein
MNIFNRSAKIFFMIVLILCGVLCTKDTDDTISANDVGQWSYYNIKNGLPSNHVYCLAQDSSNNIWIGTNKGLAKFNGSSFTYYATSTGLPSDTIYSLLCDRNSELIVGTKKGLGKISSSGIYSDIIRFATLSCVNLCQDKIYDCVHCATNLGIISYYFTDTFYLQTIMDSTLIDTVYVPDPVYDIKCDKNNYTWIAGKKGLYEWRDTDIICYSLTNLGIPIYSTISRLFSDKSGNIWIGLTCDERIIYYNGSKFIDDTIFFGMQNYNAFAQDQYSNYWISIKGYGVLNYAGGISKVYNTTNSKIVSNNINDILYDKKNNIWFASNDNGLIYYQNIKPLQIETNSNNSNNIVNPIN